MDNLVKGALHLVCDEPPSDLNPTSFLSTSFIPELFESS